MAYLGITPAVPSFGTQLARGLGSGFGEGFQSTAKKLIDSASKARKPLGLKGYNALYNSIENFSPNKFNEEHKAQIAKDAVKFLNENPNVREEDALQHVINQYSKGLQESGGLGNPEALSPLERARHTTEQGHPFGWLGEYLKPAYETAKENPSQLAKELPVALSKSAENFGSLQDPAQAIISLISGKNPLKPSQVISGPLREGLSEKDKEGAERIAEVESFLADFIGPSAAELAGKGLGLIPKTARAASTSGATEASKVAEEALGGSLSKTIAQESAAEETGLAGRAAQGSPQKANEMRIERLEPTSRLYKPQEQAELRSMQLKLVPKYEAEIAADAAKRAEQAAAREPKTPIGMAGRARRIESAEARLPQVQDAYSKAQARVRALEDEIANMAQGPQREQAERILQAATQELRAAEFDLMNAVENLKGVSTRQGLESMEQAAQQKLQKITQMVEGGEEVQLAKMDYSPDMIKQAQKIRKARKLAANKTDDFYTAVHDAYANVYRQRIAQLNADMERAMQEKGLASLQHRRLIAKERDAIQKLIDSAEAENTIHRHKLALREMQQRKVAQQRFSSLRPSKGSDKASKSFSQKAWRERFQNAPTESEKARVVEEGIEIAAKQNPSKAEAIKQEGDNLAATIKKVEQEAAKPIENPSDAKPKANRLINDLKEFKENFPNLWETRIGKDMMLGIGTAIVDDARKDLDIPVSASAIGILWGKGGGRGIGYRALFNQLTRWFLKDLKIRKAKEAYQRNDMRSFNDYHPSIQKKAKERIRASRGI